LPNLPCPYVGLQPYTEEDRAYFFGRARDQRIISSNLYAAPLTVLYGASGVGKSSILRAAVLPVLQSARRTAVVYFNRWQDPLFLDSLKSECIKVASTMPGMQAHVNLDQPLPELLITLVRNTCGALFILLDQFEEYFLYHPQSEAQSRFDSEFATAVNSRDVELGFLVAMRDDWLSRLDRLQGRIPNLLSNTYRLEHLDAAAAEDAIRKPLDVYNSYHSTGSTITIDDDLVRSVVEQVRAGQLTLSELSGSGRARTDESGNRVETAFLQLVMTRLWDQEMKAGSCRLRLETFTGLGGAKRIVQSHLENVMSGFPDDLQEICARVFRYLVTPKGAKIAHETADLVAFAGNRLEQVTSVLGQLSAKRVLRRISPPERYEVFHDVLAPAILDWGTAYQKAQERAEAVARAAAEAGEREKEAGRQREMDQIRALAEEQRRRAEERLKATRRLWRLAIALGILFPLAIVAAATSVVQLHRARQSAMLAENSRLDAQKSRDAAEVARSLAAARLERIVAVIRLKQSILSGEAIPTNYINNNIRFRANAREYPYKTKTGRPTYGFTIFPEASSVPGGLKNIAFITYRMAHHTFPNSLIATGPDRNFTASYDGVGCLTHVIALIEYTDPDTAPAVVTFNMCEELKRR
jgi:hypothetical protein